MGWDGKKRAHTKVGRDSEKKGTGDIEVARTRSLQFRILGEWELGKEAPSNVGRMTRVGRLGCGWEADPCRNRYLPSVFCTHSQSHSHSHPHPHFTGRLRITCCKGTDTDAGTKTAGRKELMGERLQEDREISR